MGTSDLSHKMQTTDLFWIASMSKPMTAVAVAMLVDEGKLKWDDPVEKFAPEFKNIKFRNRAPNRQILLRDLLNHTSGLQCNYDVTQPTWTLKEYVQQIASQPLDFHPGTNWNYSNAALDVIGYVVQVASGTPFDQFMQKRVFDPLGMKDTCFWISPENVKRCVHACESDSQAHTLERTSRHEPAATPQEDRSFNHARVAVIRAVLIFLAGGFP